MFTDRVISTMTCSVYWPLASYFLSEQWKAKILVAVLLDEQVSSKRTNDLLPVLQTLPMGIGILLLFLQLISFVQQVPRHIKCLAC